MPVIGVPIHHLNRLIGQEIERETLLQHLQHLGCDVEGFATLQRFNCGVCSHVNEVTENEDPPTACERCGFDFREDESKRVAIEPIDVIRMELLAVRPDMFDAGGLARTVRGYLGLETGLKQYRLAEPQTHVTVDPGLDDESCYRPYIVCARVLGVTFDDDLIRMLMKLQENLHWALGRNRKLASIGVYDMDTVEAPYHYRPIDKEGLTFVPLGVVDGKAFTPDGILREHPKGKAYANLLQTFDRYPLLVDNRDRVLSMPPIINSEETKVHQQSTNLFIDVTGTVERVVHRTLNIVVTSLLELDPNITVEQVEIRYPDGTLATTPDLTPQQMKVSASRTSGLIGVPLSAGDLAEHLRKMRHDVVLNGDEMSVEIAAYRNDILHERDLQEDAAISYGYHNLIPSLVESMTVGRELPAEAFAKQTRTVLEGMGYLEVMTLMLVGGEQSYSKLRQQPTATHVAIDNPVSQEQSIVRESLLYGLMETFSLNIHHDLPQMIYEVGKVSQLDDAAETGAIDFFKAAGGTISPRAGFAEIKEVVEALLRESGYATLWQAADHPSYIPGRVASISVEIGGQPIQLGLAGEIHPEILENFSLVQPVATFEIDLSPLIDRIT